MIIFKIPIVFILSLIYWLFAFTHERTFELLLFGDAVLIGVPFVVNIFKLVFSKHKAKRVRKLTSLLILMSAWIAGEIISLIVVSLGVKYGIL